MIKPLAYLLSNSRGYTLIEAIVSFGITLLIVSLLPLTLKVLIESPFIQFESKLESNIFSNQLAVDVLEANEYVAREGELEVIKQNERVSYRLISGSIRRFVGGRGYVPMLDSVQAFSCKSESEQLICDIEMQNGYIHTRAMSHMQSKIERTQ